MEQISFIDRQAESEKPSAFVMPDGGKTPTEEQPPAEPEPTPPVDAPSFFADYNAVKERHPKDIVLYQVGDSFEMFGPDARVASTLLDLNLTTSNLPDVGRVAVCGFPADALNQNIEKLRREYGVTVSQVDKETGNHVVYFMGAYPKDREQIFHPSERETPAQDAPASDFSIPDAEIESILRHGSPYDGGRLRIAVLYTQENTPAERVEYLKNEYGTNGGQTWQFSDGSRGSIATRPQGLVIRDAGHHAETRLRWSEVEGASARLSRMASI